MKKIILIASLILASTSHGLSVVLENGSVIQGVSEDTVGNPDYQPNGADDYTKTYDSKSSKQQLIASKRDGQILISDNRDATDPSYTGIQIVDGKIKSQITCHPEKSVLTGTKNICYAVNQDVCSALLAQTKVKNFSDLESGAMKSNELLDAYKRTLKYVNSWSIDEAFTTQNSSLKQQTSLSRKFSSRGWLPKFEADADPERVTSARVAGVVKICAAYTKDKAFVETVTAGTPSQPASSPSR